MEYREDIITKAHQLGHFKLESTYKQLETKYFWKNMRKDIAFVISKCLPCVRNEVVPAISNSAIALKVTDIFDRIGIDLVFGLPLTEDGYHGVLIITEYLTKFPYVVPIKTKEAKEISMHFLNYISIFGPPKELLSDQGKEFCNDMLNSFLSLMGTVHRVTSPYHPQTNGLTERFNETFIKLIRIHAENNPENWDKWIPFVTMAYRIRINSSTKFSPYELMFGRQQNDFNNFQIKQTDENNSQIYQRNFEIKQLIESIRPKALTNIERAQVQQKINQNNNNNVSDEILEPNSKVMVKSLKLVPEKLAPKYSGPLQIDSQTAKGNYYLRDRTKRLLSSSIPKSRLKPISDNIADDPFLDIDKIIKDRVRSGIKEYFVKWKNYPDSESSWVPEGNFSNLQCIEDYNNLKKESRIKQINLVTIDYKQRSNSTIGSLKLLQSMLWLIVLIANTNSMIIDDEFKYCAPTESSLRIDIDKMCPIYKINQKIDNLFPSTLQEANFTILAKRQYKVSGLGTQCSKQMITMNCTMYWYLWREDPLSFDTNIQLTQEDCLSMISTKRCGDNPMACENEECEYEQLPIPDFSWNKVRQTHGIRCMIRKIQILAVDDTKPIFPNAVQTCYPKDKMCQLQSSIIVWDTSIIHTFPYEYILEELFIIPLKEEDAIQSGTVIYSEKQQLLLNIVDTTIESNMTIFQTSEGLIAIFTDSFNINKVRLNIKNNIDNSQAIVQLQLAENDYHLRSSMKLHFRWNLQHCYSMKSFLSIFQNFDNRYIKINDIDNNELILYASQGMIYIPHCIIVKTIDTINNPLNCYSNIPISFKYQNVTKLAFLHSTRIISDVDYEMDCKTKRQIVRLQSLNRLLKAVGKTITIEYETINKKHNINFLYTNFENINYMHNKELVEGVNISAYFYYLAAQPIQERIGTMLIFPSQDSNTITLESNKNQFFNKIKEQIIHTITIIIIIIASIIIISIIVTIVICYCYFNQVHIKTKYLAFTTNLKKRKFKSKQHKEIEEVEMVELHHNDEMQINNTTQNISPLTSQDVENKEDIEMVKNNQGLSTKIKNKVKWP